MTIGSIMVSARWQVDMRCSRQAPHGNEVMEADVHYRRPA
jgi:hypothetical protein